jgi:hypothetical protein
MYLLFVSLHSLIRWLVLIAAVLAVGRAIAGLVSSRPWGSSDDRVGRFFTIAVDTQMLVGLILYGVLSPITYAAFADMGAAMKNPTLRFYAVEHVVMMVIAIALVHIGSKRVQKAASDAAKHRTAAIFYTLALVLILAAIPWPFREVGRPLLLGH